VTSRRVSQCREYHAGAGHGAQPGLWWPSAPVTADGSSALALLLGIYPDEKRQVGQAIGPVRVKIVVPLACH